MKGDKLNIKTPPCGGASRMSAEAVLKDKIRRKENEVHALKALHRCIPWDELSKEDEEKLWDYLIKE